MIQNYTFLVNDGEFIELFLNIGKNKQKGCMFFDGSKFDFEDCSGNKKYTLCKQASKYLHAFAAIDFFFSVQMSRDLENSLRVGIRGP